AQQNRPAHTLPGTLVRGPTLATAKPDRCRHKGQQRPHHQDHHPGDLEPLDDPFHRVVERHLRSPDLAGVNDATPSDAPYAPWQCANTRTAITPPPFPRKADGRACCEQATAAPPPRAC